MSSQILPYKSADGSTAVPQDFQVDWRMGFLPPQMPLSRLPTAWEAWEATLDAATSQRFKAAEQLAALGGPQKFVEEKKASAWRKLIDKMPVLSIDNIKGCERELRRAHLVLTFMVQFYAHTTPPTESITIPRSLTVPLLGVSSELNHAPFVTYSDHDLHNWSLNDPRGQDAVPMSDNIQSQLTLSGTPDEAGLYLVGLRMELKGAEALESLRLSTNEIEAGNNIDVDRITTYLTQTTKVIQELKGILMTTKELVRPEIFFNDIRPWLVGADADKWGRKWVWEGKEEVENSEQMLTKVSSPTAGQSPLIPTLDAYLGIEEDDSKSSFLDRVRVYMDHQHKEYLQSLRLRKKVIRSFVQSIAKEGGTNTPIVVAYNATIQAMKSLRDAHLVIVTLYIIIPSKKKARISEMDTKLSSVDTGPVSGEMGDHEQGSETNNEHTGEAASTVDQVPKLLKILKGFRDQTGQNCIE
ncbi:indoleamine 2,3-dioxygenase domain-containing protein [Trichoderma breve]|uniref:Indoleamine 2,3-dioxygenase domain-containing protein n=1 Tax=Trichoderma breve TaxID=2034170 RepID=A0A9W9B8E6_9HYPO|nr:indoleamine 2,3-dioxygenase domain-containing protein [Trichoderma breve]KAJ4856599.1 indoleamine 2,3-dioxygenase domain-containing protein [Trichoderma breve]